MRDGVGASVVALPSGAWSTIAQFLFERFPAVGESVWQQRLKAGDVRDEHGRAIDARTPYRAQLRVFYYRTVSIEPPMPVEARILYRDAHLLVADKPHFLPVTPSGQWLQNCLLTRLRRETGIEDLTPIHRLDRETAGLVLFSVCSSSRGAYNSLFKQRRVIKRYEAIVHWPAGGLVLPAQRESRIEPIGDSLQMHETPGSVNAITGFEYVASAGQGDSDKATHRARLRLAPLTGRKHQLRVHCAALGVPIVNDRFYPVWQAPEPDDYAAPLQLLARSLAFDDPVTGEKRRFESGLSLLA